MSGHIQIKQVINRTSGSSLILTFFGDVPNLSRAIGEKKLKDIAALSDLDYTLDVENFSDPNANTILTLCDKFKMVAVNSMSGLAITDTEYPCYIGHMTPAVKASYIFDKIIKEAGFYWNSADMADALDNVYVPFVASQYLQTDQGFQNAYFNLGIISDVTGITSDYTFGTINEFVDNGGNVSAGIFTVPYFGQFTFRYWANVERTSGSGNTAVRFVLKDVVSGQIYAFSSSNIVFASNQTIHREEILTHQFTAGTQLQLVMEEVTGAGTYTLNSSATNDPQEGIGWQLDSASTPLLGAGVTVLMQQNAPDIRQIDFFNAVVRRFKCAIVPDAVNENTIRVVPMVDYIGTGDTVDWTLKLDTNEKDILIYPTTDIQPRTFTIKDKADGDANNALYTNSGKRTYGQYVINQDNWGEENISDFATSDESIELATGSTPCSFIQGTGIVTPSFIDDGGSFVLPTCRLLYKSGTATIQTVNNSFVQQAATVYTLNHYEATTADLTDNDLNFGVESPLYPIAASPYNTVWFRYWSKYFRELYSSEARIMEAYFNLTLIDILNFGFDDKIWIDHPNVGRSYWRVLEIQDFDAGAKQSTKCKLIRVLDLGLDCDFTPQSRTINGYIRFVDGNGDVSDGSQKCCVKYGYSWNADEGKCYPNSQGSTTGRVPLNVLNEVEQGFQAKNLPVNDKTITASYNLVPEDSIVTSDTDTAGANITITLPFAKSMRGRRVTIINISATHKTTVTAQSGEYVGKDTHIDLNQKNASITLTSNGIAWA